MTWPALDVRAWAGTKRRLHLAAQMLGKLRLQYSPSQPNWTFTSLQMTARGFSTGCMPVGDASLDAELDVVASEIVLRHSSGDVRRIPLATAATIADVHHALLRALDALGVRCTMSPVPQEIADTTPFDRDTRPAEWDTAAVRRWFTVTTATAGVFERWRAHFFGRSGVYLWWGAFDLAVMLFNGRHVVPPTDRGYLLTYDLDAELMNCGLYFGDENTAPFFYGYISPEPAGAASFAMPSGVSWSASLSEWVLPYDAVASADAPEAVLRAFLDALYAHCLDQAGWDGAALRYAAPPRGAHAP